MCKYFIYLTNNPPVKLGKVIILRKHKIADSEEIPGFIFQVKVQKDGFPPHKADWSTDNGDVTLDIGIVGVSVG